MTDKRLLPTHDRPLDQHEFWIEPTNGKPPHRASVAEFYSKSILEDSRCGPDGDLSSRSMLTNDFVAVMIAQAPPKKGFSNAKWAWRKFLEFLSERTDLPRVRRITDINEVHGIALKQWLFERENHHHCYKRIKQIIDAYYYMELLRPSPLPPRDHFAAPEKTEIDLQALQQLNLAFRREAREQKNMYSEGLKLAAKGEDPRSTEEGWLKQENHAFLVHEISSDRLRSADELQVDGIHAKLFNLAPGPSYLSPWQQNYAGYSGKLRWFHPGFHDTAIFLWIFLLHTGWNLATALDVDISDEGRWFQPSFQRATHVLMLSYKERAGTWVFAPSLAKPELHAYQIIQFMIERTKPLRETLRHRLELVREHQKKHPTQEMKVEINRLERAIKSPWLYHLMKQGGAARAITLEDGRELNTMARVVASQTGLDVVHPSLKALTCSKPRKAVINFVMDSTGQAYLAQLSGSHKSQRSLRSYLHKGPGQRANNLKVAGEVIAHTVNEIKAKGVVDATRIRLLLQNGEITLEQERRLLNIRERSRVGLGCLSPQTPPRTIAPDHAPGQLCRVQRCTGCELGIVFPESVGPLAQTLADLHFEKRSMPLSAWVGSSLEDEEKSIVETLKQFDPVVVREIYTARMRQLKNGTVRSFNVYPIY